MTFATEAQARDFIVQTLGARTKPSIIVIPTTHGYWAITSASALKAGPAIVCVICGESFREFPNNAQPVASGQCCAYCDDAVVTPARIKLAVACL